MEDLFYDPKGYRTENTREMYSWAEEETDWLPVAPSPAFSMRLNKLANIYANVLKEDRLNSHSLLLGVGVAFGDTINGQVEMAKYVGGVRILGTV